MLSRNDKHVYDCIANNKNCTFMDIVQFERDGFSVSDADEVRNSIERLRNSGFIASNFDMDGRRHYFTIGKKPQQPDWLA